MSENGPKIKIFEGANLLQEIPLTKSQVSLGRATTNDLIMNNPRISRQHLILSYKEGFWEVTNLSETDPVFFPTKQYILGQNQSVRLQSGEKFRVGDYDVEITYIPRPRPANSAPAPAASGASAQALADRPTTIATEIPAQPQPNLTDRPTVMATEIPAQPQPNLADRRTAMASEEQRIDRPFIPPAVATSTLPSAPVEPEDVGGTLVSEAFRPRHTDELSEEAAAAAEAAAIPPEPDDATETEHHPHLIIARGGRQVEVILTKPEITIGRDMQSDIVIDARTVSRKHAVLRRDADNKYTLIDQNSANGLSYQGERVKEIQLKHRDVVYINDNFGNFVSLTYFDPVHVGAGGTRRIPLDPATQAITIGRHSRNDVVFPYQSVSAFHARIRRVGNSVLLEDLGSTNGTFLHGRQLRPRTPEPIVPGDVILIANFRLSYQADALVVQYGNEVRLDALKIVKTVNNGRLTLLNDITLSIEPGEFVAIVGGSGTGKSTLLNALNGFQPASEGRVLVNGEDYYKNFAAYRSSIGYVPQDDIIHRELPVEKALYYVARLRLPKDTSDDEINARIEQVLEDVEISHRRDVPVSRLSGGQRKRVSIAVELLANPNLFFLDEPTSGLDPGLEKRMMVMLRRLANQGRTIVLITHATTNISQCHKVVFLAPGGRLCFYGAPHEALQFFDVDDFADIYTLLEEAGPDWEALYRTSAEYKRYVLDKLDELPDETRNLKANVPVQDVEKMRERRKVAKTSSLRQFGILTQRYLDLLIRDRINVLVLLLQAPIIAIILALVAGNDIFALGKSPANALQVLFIFSVSAVWLGTNNAAREICKEAPIYTRERLVNLKVIPYIMSKVVVLATLCLVQSVILTGLVLYVAGSPAQSAFSFLPVEAELIIGVWLTTLGGLGMGLLISVIASNTDKATSIVPIVLIPQIILAGIIFPLDNEAEYLGYVTISKWSIDSLGTSADINRLFYPIYGPVAKGLGGTFVPTNYDDNPSAQKYPPAVKPTAINTQASRQPHLLRRWGIQFGIFVGLIVVACFFQWSKDWARVIKKR